MSKDRWVNDSIRSRWIDVVIYATASAFAFEILLPLGVRLFRKAPSAGDYQPWFVLAVGVLGVIVMAFIVAEPIRSAAIIGSTLTGIRRFGSRRRWPSSPRWICSVSALSTAPNRARLGACLARCHARCGVHRCSRSSPNTVASERTTPSRYRSRRGRAAVEHSETGSPPRGRQTAIFWPRVDLTRIANTLLDQSCEQAIALLGPFGSGKSSILARVHAMLQDSAAPMFIIAEFNGWAIPQATNAPRVALEQ